MRVFPILLILLFCFSAMSYAQHDDVKVDMGVLQGYTPPPMFGASPSPAPVKSKPEKPKTKEPEFSESDIVQPTAAEILRQIEAMEAKPAKLKKKEAEASKPVAVKNDPVRVRSVGQPVLGDGSGSQDVIVTEAGGPFFLSLPLLPEEALGETALSTVQTDLLPRARAAGHAVRIELRSYAQIQDEPQNESRRVSLKRALALKEFMIQNGLSPRSIDILPLGAKAPDLPKNRIDITLAPL